MGFTLKLVDKAARKGSDESDSEYYDDEEDEVGGKRHYSNKMIQYTEEEYWDEDEEYEEEEYTDEAYEEEGDECMLSAEEKVPAPPPFLPTSLSVAVAVAIYGQHRRGAAGLRRDRRDRV